ncbi:10712_t:CDS:2, partial [Dentiscutata heterogama]
SQSLDRDKVPLLCRLLDDETGMSQRLEAQLPQSSVSSSNDNPIEKIDRKPIYSTGTLASFRYVVEE